MWRIIWSSFEAESFFVFLLLFFFCLHPRNNEAAVAARKQKRTFLYFKKNKTKHKSRHKVFLTRGFKWVQSGSPGSFSRLLEPKGFSLSDRRTVATQSWIINSVSPVSLHGDFFYLFKKKKKYKQKFFPSAICRSFWHWGVLLEIKTQCLKLFTVSCCFYKHVDELIYSTGFNHFNFQKKKKKNHKWRPNVKGTY